MPITPERLPRKRKIVAKLTRTIDVDEEARPLTKAELAKLKPVALARAIRFKLGLSQIEFAEKYGFALGTLRAWEQHQSAPDKGTQSYLELIEADPKAVAKIRERMPHR